MRRSLVFAAALTMTMLAASPGLAADGGIEIVSPTEAKLTFGDSRSASVELTVLNRSQITVTPSVALFDLDSGTVYEAATRTPDADIQIETSETAIPAMEARQLAVTVRLREGFDPSDLDAVFVVSAVGLDATTIPVVIASPDSAFLKARVEPAAATINATRLWPSFVGSTDAWAYLMPGELTTPERRDAPRFVIDVTGVTAGSIAPPVTTHLGSDRGGRLQVVLLGLSGRADTQRAEIRLGESDAAGTYSGKMTLDPTAEKSAAIDLKVNVQDLFIWPLLFLIAGSLGAYALTRSRDQGRPRKALIYNLKRLADRVASDLAQPCFRDRDGRWLGRRFSIRDGVARLDPAGRATGDELYAEILRADTAEALTDLEAKILDLDELIGFWEQACPAGQELNGRWRAHRHLDPLAGVFTAAKTLLDRTKRLADADDAEAFVSAIRDGSIAIELLAKAHKSYERATELWNQLTDVERAAHTELDPEPFWIERVRVLETKQEFLDQGPVEALAEINRDIAAIIAGRPRRPDVARTAFELDRLPQLQRDSAEAETAEQLEATLATVRPIERRPAEAILANLRSLDTADFFLSGAITAVAFFLTIYVDKNFGSGWQYVSAFVAGLAGTLVINWKLLPWYREYRLSAAPTS